MSTKKTKTPDEINTELREVRSDIRELGKDFISAKRSRNVRWLRDLRNWHKQLLRKVERLIGDCDRATAAAE